MPELVRMYIRNVAIGFGLAAVFVGLLVFLDIGRIGSLILGSDAGPVALIMLIVFNGVVFAGVQFGIAIMRLADESDPPQGGGRVRASVPQPARATVQAGRKWREPRQP